MNLTIKTAFGYLSVQPNGSLQFRDTAGPWETFEVDGLELPAPGPSVPPEEAEMWTSCGTNAGFDLVQCVIHTINPPHTPEGAFEVTKRVAWLLRDQGVGLLLKSGGANVVTWGGVSYSAGRVCYGNGRIIKILTDVPTTNGPSWQDDNDLSGVWSRAIDPDAQ